LQRGRDTLTGSSQRVGLHRLSTAGDLQNRRSFSACCWSERNSEIDGLSGSQRKWQGRSRGLEFAFRGTDAVDLNVRGTGVLNVAELRGLLADNYRLKIQYLRRHCKPLA